MGFRINNNIAALVAQGHLNRTQSGFQGSIERLSSGLRINRGADDAAGLTISEKLRGQIRGLNRAIGNSQDGISLIQTAEGALNEDAAILNRLRELSIQSQADSLTSSDRLEIQKEVDQLVDEIDRISKTTEFNTKKLLDGSANALVSTDNRNLVAHQVGHIGEQAAGDYKIEINLSEAGAKQIQKSAILSDKDSGETAGLGSRLSDIASFYDNDGNLILENPKTITLRGNGQKASITVSADLTVQQMTDKVETAITSSISSGGLGLTGATFAMDVKSSQIIFESSRDGANGELAIAADENFIRALGMQITTEAKAAAHSVSASKTGLINTSTTSANTTTNIASGVIQGLNLDFELPSEARFDGSVAGEEAIHISSATDVIFTLHDTNAGSANSQNMAPGSMTAGATIVLTAGRTFSKVSIESIVNHAIQFANDYSSAYTRFAVANGGVQSSSLTAAPQITASFEGMNLVFTSSAEGTSGTISVQGNANAANILGIQNSKVSGSGGTSAVLTGSVDISNGITLSGSGVQSIQIGDGDFNINSTDALGSSVPGSISTDISFNRGQVISAASILDTFNLYFSTNGVQATAALDSGGRLEIRSTETGSDAKVSISVGASGGSLAQFGFISGQNDLGEGGTAAILRGQTHEDNSTVGFIIGGFMSFQVTDKSGATTNRIYFGNGGADGFPSATVSHTISKESIVSILDASNLGSTDVGYKFDAGNRLDFFSRSSGQDSRIVLSTSVANMGTFGINGFGIDFNSATQGNGEKEFNLHVSNRALNFQIGANKSQSLKFSVINTSAESLSLKGLDITNVRSATRALGSIDNAVNLISSERSKLGSLQNRLSSTINNLRVTSTNLQATESKIRDVDVAKETVTFTRNQILIQAGTAQLSQARGIPENAIQLLG